MGGLKRVSVQNSRSFREAPCAGCCAGALVDVQPGEQHTDLSFLDFQVEPPVSTQSESPLRKLEFKVWNARQTCAWLQNDACAQRSYDAFIRCAHMMRSYDIGYVASLTVTLSLFFVPRPLLSTSTFPHTLHHTICTPLLRLHVATPRWLLQKACMATCHATCLVRASRTSESLCARVCVCAQECRRPSP